MPHFPRKNTLVKERVAGTRIGRSNLRPFQPVRNVTVRGCPTEHAQNVVPTTVDLL